MEPTARDNSEPFPEPSLPERSADPRSPIIYLIDPKRLTRECVTHSLQSLGGFSRVVAIPALESADPSTSPDLMIVNLGSQPVRSVGATRVIEAVARWFTEVPFIVMGEHDHPDMAYEAIRLGARGYIHTSLALSVAAAALRLVLAGGTFVPGPALASNGEAPPLPDSDIDSNAGMLTRREHQVLHKIHQGKTNRQIAQELHVRESTVKSHIRQIKHKTRLANRVELALNATRLLAHAGS